MFFYTYFDKGDVVGENPWFDLENFQQFASLKKQQKKIQYYDSDISVFLWL